eukprot:6456979-Amphidinium_carterae.1
MERFLCRPSFELEVKVVALICAMGLADETVSVAGVLDDELPLSAWISAQRTADKCILEAESLNVNVRRMLQAPADLLDALGSFPPHSARCSQEVPCRALAHQKSPKKGLPGSCQCFHCALHIKLWECAKSSD